ncbi:type III-A CRISPR-associated RAMP protein Csm3 [Pasteurella atlantica]|uniref:type III-A CRISPR-associated RAMP protein Csm3 n=1 Tax=Pasteurellaceae TaxID=712 RepID=UPI0027599298|nr:type III-A CRISPR-associated RAMP protein Csm3 [Pasteurella atlantica]MDP8033564.1 type III-A CRISPR-associated RAMP protein Csm3 [Pasteurella atlantica]MDP8035499.1 type III-A CRISPR-associated RAMP protein Csm3 [Pasteurella atlantica]MDP8037450.1 type III-A CRISPR-associated RAMP protein Csm3 [Pasteurella atlantica]MDP8047799.1 type III-A CRISPR-associated RAMP protein Csm3 [Pasteurella atlantica]MDP8049640.1 type III-A CRISPR-associated RAMP protein Csm3 [Pasteurella atlantica]
MKLEKIIEITATLRLETGLHIGAGDSEMHIGGIGNSVIKHPFTQSPYIPGSSLKGKIRSLLEWRSGKVQETPLSLNDFKDGNKDVKQILQLFGIGADSENDEKKLQEIGVSRLAFWDCSLNKDWEDKIREDNLLLTEAKSENTINRITATADHPRQTERVPAGAKFDFKLTMRKFESDDGKGLLELVLKGLRLLELDSLGGSGSRGYGKVKFEKLMVDNVEKDLTTINPFE